MAARRNPRSKSRRASAAADGGRATRRGGRNRKPERPEPPEPLPPPPPSFPNPWFPDIAIHLYGASWDLENLPDSPLRSQLLGALSGAFPGRTSRVAFDPRYPSVGNSVSESLSVGLWTAGAMRPDHDAARRAGLLAMRTTGRPEAEGEIQIGFGYLVNEIVRRLPSTVPIIQNREFTYSASLASRSVSIVPPASLLVSAGYSIDTLIVGAVNPVLSSTITLGASNGDVTATSTPITLGLQDGGTLLGTSFLNPAGLTVLVGGVLGLLGLGWFAVHNIGSGREALPPLPSIPVSGLTGLLPREIPVDSLKLALRYLAPAFVTRGASAANPGTVVLRIPFTWGLVSRVPRLTISGPSSVKLPLGDADGAADVAFRAVSDDFVRPQFTWLVDGVPQPNATTASEWLTLRAPVRRAGATHRFTIEARAVDAASPTVSARTSVSVLGTVVRPARGDL